MQLLIKTIQIIFLSVFLNLTFTHQSFALEDAILAVVNSEIITLKDLRDYVRRTYVELVTEGVSKEELNQIMKELENNGLNKLIEDRLILSQANKIGIEVREKLIEERVNEIKSKYTSEQSFIDAVVGAGGTLTELKEKVKDRFKIQYVIEYEVKSKIYVNPQEVTNYYQKNIESFQMKESYDLDSIFVPYNNDKAEALLQANKALKLIERGQTFEEIAKEYSQGPSLGLVEEGQLLPQLEEALISLKPGELTSLIEVDNGIYILKLKNRTSKLTAPLQEVKNDITNFLYNQKLTQRLTEWLEKLKKNAYIEIKK